MSNDSIQPVGRGSGLAPVNRFTGIEIQFDPEHLEYDAEALNALRRPPTRYFEDSARSIVSENDSPDIPFRYSLNPYRGCLHGCSYCYARPSHEYLGLNAGLDFETTIFVKKNAGKLFRSWLARPGYEAEQVTLSGITDCYQPIERTMKITRDCLQIACDTLHPISIITKNRLVSRDIDLLAKMASQNVCRVCMSINSLDQSLSRIMEPACSAPAARITVIRELTEAGIPVHLMVAPVVPGLNDHEIPAVLESAASAGATSASFIVLRLPQVVEEIFLDWLARKQPQKHEVVISRIKAVRGGRLTSSAFGTRMSGEGQIAEQIRQLFNISARKFGLKTNPEPLRTDLFEPPDPVDGQMRLF